MWAKSVPRPCKRQSACDDPVVEDPQWTVRIERQHDDVRLHESLGRLKRERYRRRVTRDRLQLLAHLFNGYRRGNGTRPRRSRERQVRRPVSRQLQVITLVDRTHPIRNLCRELRENEDSIQRQALPRIAAWPSIRTEWRTGPDWPGSRSSYPLSALCRDDSPGLSACSSPP